MVRAGAAVHAFFFGGQAVDDHDVDELEAALPAEIDRLQKEVGRVATHVSLP